MGSLKGANPDIDEFVTQILDDDLLWSAMDTVIRLLSLKGAKRVEVAFGFILDRDLRGETQPTDQTVELSELKAFMKEGLREGTIEWNGQSDFIFESNDIDLKVMLCNDADLHFASADTALLHELGRTLKEVGIKLYQEGQPI